MALNEFIESLYRNHKDADTVKTYRRRVMLGNENQFGDYDMLVMEIGDSEYTISNQNGDWKVN